MKKIINAYLYPKPDELDRQLALRGVLQNRQLFQREAIADLLKSEPPFDPRDFMSVDEHDSVEMTDVDRIVRNIFAELLGVPAEFLTVRQLRAGELPSPTGLEAVATPDLRKMLERYLSPEAAERFIPNAPDEFVYRSHNGKQYNVTDMATPHLFYSLRMIFNHTVPPAFRVLRPGEQMRRYLDVPFWTDEYRRNAVEAFVAELENRDDLDEDLAAQYADMQANTRVILALGL